ncbi:MAG: three-Cys-motif partner protein TcmP [Leptospira sp.]|nr:three-Cys-motif partner protein TcmP [Leptospira sp.]
MGRDLHKKTFDDGTNTKLNIFQSYLFEWIPVFLKTNYFNEINIIDAFSGPGHDLLGNKGSPLIIMDAFKSFRDHITDTRVNVYFNEFNKNKFQRLRNEIEIFSKQNDDFMNKVSFNLTCLDFNDFFTSIKPNLNKNIPNFLFLDQNGIKFITKDIFKYLVNLEKTDFLFYISSSYLRRFGDTPEFSRYLNIPLDELKEKPFHEIHLQIVDFFQREIPPSNSNDYWLYPFSIKKGGNVFGLVFGSRNILAADKFLKVAWGISPKNGNANFDIEQDEQKSIENSNIPLFPSLHKRNKVQAFQDTVSKRILSGEIKNNINLYVETLRSGHLPKHSREVLINLKKEGRIFYEKNAPAVSYDAYRDKNIKLWKVL